MNTNIFDEFPGAKEHMNQLRENSIYNFLNYLRHHDEAYKKMITDRAAASMDVKGILEKNENGGVFEIYSDAIYAVERYEMNKIYEQGFLDALKMLKSTDI